MILASPLNIFPKSCLLGWTPSHIWNR
jgi:hypothetical protein